ncbi:MAG: 2-hydroxyacyl-CoA dehydratase family protein [Planctomycetota bacterium]
MKTLEQSGCYIVDDEMMLGQRWFTRDVPLDGDPIGNLAHMFLHASLGVSVAVLEQGEKGAALVASERAAKAEGVIFSLRELL